MTKLNFFSGWFLFQCAAAFAVETNLFDQYKAFLKHPPTIESLQWRDLRNDIHGKPQTNFYWLTWQTNASVLMTTSNALTLAQHEARQGELGFVSGRFNNDHWRVFGFDWELTGWKDRGLPEENRSIIKAGDDDEVDWSRAMTMGIPYLSPGAIVWSGTNFSGVHPRHGHKVHGWAALRGGRVEKVFVTMSLRPDGGPVTEPMEFTWRLNYIPR